MWLKKTKTLSFNMFFSFFIVYFFSPLKDKNLKNPCQLDLLGWLNIFKDKHLDSTKDPQLQTRTAIFKQLLSLREIHVSRTSEVISGLWPVWISVFMCVSSYRFSEPYDSQRCRSPKPFYYFCAVSGGALGGLLGHFTSYDYKNCLSGSELLAHFL